MNEYEDPYRENPYSSSSTEPLQDRSMDKETNQWATILHLSQFAGYAVPIAGFVAPLLIWLLKKDDLPGIDVHGRHVINWIISEVIYLILGVILVFVLIGIPLLIVLGIVGVVFPIIGAIKASDGVAWKYPMTISLL